MVSNVPGVLKLAGGIDLIRSPHPHPKLCDPPSDAMCGCYCPGTRRSPTRVRSAPWGGGPGAAPRSARPGGAFTPRDLGHQEPTPLALRPYSLSVPVCDFSRMGLFGGLARPPGKKVRTCPCTCAPGSGRTPLGLWVPSTEAYSRVVSIRKEPARARRREDRRGAALGKAPCGESIPPPPLRTAWGMKRTGGLTRGLPPRSTPEGAASGCRGWRWVGAGH